MGKLGSFIGGLLVFVFVIVMVAGLSGSATAQADANKAADNLIGSAINAGVAVAGALAKGLGNLGAAEEAE